MAAKRVFEGLTWVVIGLILLANTTGVLPWSVWWNVLMLWPLLLVSAGIDILGRALNSTALRVLASVVVIGGLVLAVMAGGGYVAMPGFGTARTGGEVVRRSEPASGAQRGRAQVDVGAARLSVKAGDELVSTEAGASFGEPRVRVSDDAGVAVVRVDMGEDRWLPATRPDASLDVALQRDLPWERVKVDAGMADLDVDLSELDVERFELNVGMSSVDVKFGDVAAETFAELSGGMTSYRLRVPESLGVELRVENGLGSVDVPRGWERVRDEGPFEGTWRSDGYDAATRRLRLVVKTGMSNVDVVTY